MRMLVGFVLALMTAVGVAQETVAIPGGAGYVERELRVHVPDSGSNGLDVLEVYVATPGKHPLVLLTHGTSADQEERKQLTPWMQWQQALWFARRGYVALVIVRKGYGNSGGQQDGATNGGCRGGSFEDVGERSIEDLKQTVKYAAANLPEADTSTILSAGVSTGGFAQVALAAEPPPGLKAAISFAGGRGGDGKEDLCNEDGLLAAFRSFGKKARTPMLWIYSENDHWFPPKYAVKFQAEFERGGGVDEFVQAPADGDDGHHLYNHVSAWSEYVDKFLSEHGLLPLAGVYPLPTPPKVDPPNGLSERGLEAFKMFLISGPHKAFATTGHGTFGYASGQMTQELADQKALDNCKKSLKLGAGPCALVR